MQSLFTSLRSAIARGWAFNRTLTVAATLHFALIPFAAALIFLDPQVITGMPAWIKPLKFAISGGIYGVTFGWFLTFVQGRRRWVEIAATVTGVALLVETILISMQVIRGVPSHFNNTTAFDAAVFSTMGGFIALLATMNLLLAIWLLFQKLPDRAFGAALRWGTIIAFAGMAVGGLMSAPTSGQMAALEAGETVNALGAHSVGVADGGPGLPLLGWSTVGGDLRAAHFLGLHGMQILPLAAWLLSRRRLRRLLRRLLSEGHRTALVHLAGVGCLGLTVLLAWQALRGQSVIAPDGLTLAAYAGLFGVMALGVLGVWLHASGMRAGHAKRALAV
jgi:hypothetical protein